MLYRYRGPRNAAGWPLRKKTVFDVAAKRRADRAIDVLNDAIAHLQKTDLDLDLWHALPLEGLDILKAVEILEACAKRVYLDNNAAQKAAKQAPRRETCAACGAVHEDCRCVLPPWRIE